MSPAADRDLLDQAEAFADELHVLVAAVLPDDERRPHPVFLAQVLPGPRPRLQIMPVLPDDEYRQVQPIVLKGCGTRTH